MNKLINKYLIISILTVLTISCAQNFMRYEVFKHIDSCKAEFDKYHPLSQDPDIASKICSRVLDRMCIINQYCKKDDKECVRKANEAYPPYGRFINGTDVKYCLGFVEEIKQEKLNSK